MFLTRSILTLGATLALCFSVHAMAAESAPVSDATATTISSQNEVAEKVNINTASVEQLDKLKGVGASKAQAIVDYRTQHGPFKSVEDLANVKGLSQKTVATLVAKNPNIITIE